MRTAGAHLPTLPRSSSRHSSPPDSLHPAWTAGDESEQQRNPAVHVIWSARIRSHAACGASHPEAAYGSRHTALYLATRMHRDAASLRLPSTVSPTQLCRAVRSFVHGGGRAIESFVGYTAGGNWTVMERQRMENDGVHIEEGSGKHSRGCGASIVTRLLALALTTQAQAEGAQSSQPALLLLSDDVDLLPALALLTRCGLFEQVLLVHNGGDAIADMTRSIPLAELLLCYPPTECVRRGKLHDWQEQVEEDCCLALRRHTSVGGIPGGITPPSSATSTPATAALYRSLSVSPPSSASSSSHSSLSPSPNRDCLQAFAAIVQCCEREKIIPRESVLRKKLLDGHTALGVDFEDFLACVVDSGVGIVEGCRPQRVVWPGDGRAARRFACADYFQPTQRLSAEQTQELVTFLYRVRPDVERGRFGFAQWLSRHGPRFIQALPHGVLVELVQLLLNNRVLQFRKGRVSVAASGAVGQVSFASTPTSALYKACLSSRQPAGGVEGRLAATLSHTLVRVPSVSTPSERSFVPTSVLPSSAPFNAVGLLLSLCSARRLTPPSACAQYPAHLPLYHYEQSASPTSASAVWVSVCTLVFHCEPGTAHDVARQFKSTPHLSQEAALQESARRALQDALWYVCFDRCMSEVKRRDGRRREGESGQQRQLLRLDEQQRTDCEERRHQHTADSMTRLDRHLAFLGQPAIVYTLQAHVLQNTVGARTLWQARGQVMLEGTLLPADRVRVRAWNGSELVLSSKPEVSYSAQARKAEAKALVSQQLLDKLSAATAQLAAQLPPLQPASKPRRSTATPVVHLTTALAARHSPTAAYVSTYGRPGRGEGREEACRASAPHSASTPSRNQVPLCSSTLFAFPFRAESPRLSSATPQHEFGHTQHTGRTPSSYLSPRSGEDYCSRYDEEGLEGKEGEDAYCDGLV